MPLKACVNFTISFMTLLKKCRENGLDCNSLIELEHSLLRERNRHYHAVSKKFDRNLKDESVEAFSKFRKTEMY